MDDVRHCFAQLVYAQEKARGLLNFGRKVCTGMPRLKFLHTRPCRTGCVHCRLITAVIEQPFQQLNHPCALCPLGQTVNEEQDFHGFYGSLDHN